MRKYTKESAMRYALVIGLWCSAGLFGAMVYRLVFKEVIDYYGMSALILALSGFIATLVTGKYKQKKIEQGNDKK